MAPMYDLICPKCKKEIEVFCKYEDRNSFTCEDCKEPLEVKPSNCGVHFKGNGWYCTDYKGKSYSDYEWSTSRYGTVKPGDFG